MGIGLHRGVAAVLAAMLSAALLSGCTEKPQLLVPTSDPALQAQARDGSLRERTLNQGESDRMAY
jgi:hypothetical protein